MNLQENIEQLRNQQQFTFDDLLRIVRILRSEQGCPWDREQDHHSIRSSLIEETYEVIEAIDTEDPVLLQEELGDLLLQIVFHTQIESESDVFCMGDVLNGICRKMISRHPHVFGTVRVRDSAEVLSNWETIKTAEKQRNTLEERLKAIPPMLPALMRASKVSKKAGKTEQVTDEMLLDRLSEQLASFREHSVSASDIGDFLLTATQLSQLSGVDAEHALSDATDRLIADVAKEN